MHNEQRIEIGIVGHTPAWQLLLEQIGVAWSPLEDVAVASRYSLVIVNRPVEQNERRLLNEYLNSGGALLYTVGEQHEVKNAARSKHYVASIPPQTQREFPFNDIFDMHHDAFFFEDGSFVKIRQKEDGIYSYLGIDVEALFDDVKSKRKNFYTVTGKYPNECVSRVSKNVLFHGILSLMESLHHQRNLPFVHKWFYPENNRTIFTFRVDSDKGSQQQIEEIYQLGEKYRIPTSWFLDVKSHEPWLEYFRKFERQEIGIHCYEHVVHKSEILNKENFERAITVLRKHTLNPRGIASPTGAWNKNIGTLFQQLNFLYSSEFAYDYDNLPSFPPLVSSHSTVIQLPVHPVCVGTMVRERMSAEEMIGYFKFVIDSKIQQREPICLYHHPTHGHNEVFEDVFQYINLQKILKLSYTEYAEWWKRRTQCTISVRHDCGTLKLSGLSSDDVWVRISLPSGKERLVPEADGVVLDENQFDYVRQEYRPPGDLMRVREFTMKHYIQNALDWWIKVTE